MDKRKMLALGILGKGGVSPIPYRFNDEFSTLQSAPLTNPRTADGIGEWDVIDSSNRQSIGEDGLTVGAAVATYNPNLDARAALTPVQGTAVVWRVKKQASGSLVTYWRRIGYGQAFNISGTNVQCASVPQVGVDAGTDWNSYYYVFDATLNMIIGIQNSKLLAVTNASGQTCLPSIGAYTGGGLYNCDYARVGDLSGIWSQSLCVLTSRNTNPNNNATLTMEADAYIEYQFEGISTAEIHDCMFRRTDDDNCWIVRLNYAGNTIKLVEKVAGVETERGSVALDTGGYYPWVKLVCDDETIKVWSRDVLKVSYTSASFNKTATSVKVTGFTNGEMSQKGIYCWPRNLSVSAVAELQRLG